MASIREMLNERVARLMFKEFSIDDVRDVSPHFRRFRVAGESLRMGACAPGDKLQIMIAEAGPRTFSPFAPNSSAGTFEILAYVHGDTPAASWARRVQRGQPFRAFGPRGSLPLSSLSGPVVLFGDETSLGTAKSLVEAHGAADGVRFVFECTDPSETTAALADLGLRDAAVVRRSSDRAHDAELEAQLTEALAKHPDATLVLTGHAQAIQAVRARLPRRKDGQARKSKVKAYWADGKRGLD